MVSVLNAPPMLKLVSADYLSYLEYKNPSAYQVSATNEVSELEKIQTISLQRLISDPDRDASGISLVQNSSNLARLQKRSNTMPHFFVATPSPSWRTIPTYLLEFLGEFLRTMMTTNLFIRY